MKTKLFLLGTLILGVVTGCEKEKTECELNHQGYFVIMNKTSKQITMLINPGYSASLAPNETETVTMNPGSYHFSAYSTSGGTWDGDFVVSECVSKTVNLTY